jgi:hypothetical protein
MVVAAITVPSVIPGTGAFPPLVTAVVQLVFTGFIVVSAAITATLYALRVSGPTSVAAVFD